MRLHIIYYTNCRTGNIIEQYKHQLVAPTLNSHDQTSYGLPLHNFITTPHAVW